MPCRPVRMPASRSLEAYAKHVARDAFFWAWPLVNVYNKRRAPNNRKSSPMPGPCRPRRSTGIVMLTDYVAAGGTDRRLPEPGCGLWRRLLGSRPIAGRHPGSRFRRPLLGLSGRRFAHRQLRPSSARCMAPRRGSISLSARIGRETVPKGINKVFRASTSTGFVVAAHLSWTIQPKIKLAIQARCCSQIMMYPLAEYDGKMKSIDWSTSCRDFPYGRDTASEEIRWVPPGNVLRYAAGGSRPMRRPCPAKRRVTRKSRSVLEAATKDPKLKACDDSRPRSRADERSGHSRCSSSETTASSFQHHWSTISNEAAFGGEPTTSRAPPLPSPIFSSTRRMKRSISIRISTRTASASTARTATR